MPSLPTLFTCSYLHHMLEFVKMFNELIQELTWLKNIHFLLGSLSVRTVLHYNSPINLTKNVCKRVAHLFNRQNTNYSSNSFPIVCYIYSDTDKGENQNYSETQMTSSWLTFTWTIFLCKSLSKLLAMDKVKWNSWYTNSPS